uniref:ATP synthase subunit a n=1 Tax=Symphylella sp. YG-2006 TaxID=390856 RepID=B7S766_9MYRI|nr:ATP synthase F0 subunit 6 [Symphylella sp. YG-2006]ABQ01735.1 ATP synthase F0 subunit 6 [Symphylella sp. YG-2006]
MMMTSLFATFDPTSSWSILPNWIILLIILMTLPKSKWLMTQSSSLMSIALNLNHSSTKTELSKSSFPGNSNMMFALLFFILTMNLWGMCPHIFTLTSHLSITLSLGLPFWISFMIYGWVKSPNLMLAHMVPNGTPAALTMFMVLIETLSNMVRPLTLSLRLAANLMAGHMLMSLAGSAGSSLNLMALPMFILLYQFLIILECMVALIQPVVFSMLVKMYASEVN